MKKDRETLEINNELVAEFSEFANDSSKRIDYTVGNSQEKFKSLKKIGFFSNGLSSVEKGFEEIQRSMQQYSKIINGYFTDLSEVERKLIEYVDGIKVPDDLKLNSAFSVSDRNKVNLSKDDGKSIKGGSTSNVEEIKVGEDVIKEDLENITKADVKTSEYDDSSAINKIVLEGFNNSKLEEKQEEPIIDLERKNLENINTNNNTTIKDENLYIDELKDEEEKEQENDYEVES